MILQGRAYLRAALPLVSKRIHRPPATAGRDFPEETAVILQHRPRMTAPSTLLPSDAPVREPESDVERPPSKEPGRRRLPIEEPPKGSTDDPDPADDPAPIDEPGDTHVGLDRAPVIDEPDPPSRTPREP